MTTSLTTSQSVPYLVARYHLKYLAFGTLTLLIFDILLTLRAEVAYVWRRPWSLFKTLHVICRYGPIVIPCFVLGMPSDTPQHCLVSEWSLLFETIMLCIFPLDCLLAIRLDRLYTSKCLRRVLIALIISEAIVYITVVSLNVGSTQADVAIAQNETQTFKFCTLKAHLKTGVQISPGIPFLVIAALYFAFAGNAFYGHLRQRVTLTKHRFLRESGTVAPVLTVLFRDGIVCYLLNFATSAVGLVLYGVYGRTLLFDIVSLLIAANASIISSRLVHVLRGDPSYATGIYRAGNELQIVNEDDHDKDSQLEFTHLERERANTQYFGDEDGILSVPLDLL